MDVLLNESSQAIKLTQSLREKVSSESSSSRAEVEGPELKQLVALVADSDDIDSSADEISDSKATTLAPLDNIPVCM